MGKYAFFVWGSYGITALVLLLSVALPWLRLRGVRARLREALAATDARP